MKKTLAKAGLSLVRIRSFIAVAEEMQFKRASERLAMTQPAVTTHIQELEEFLGVALLRRTTRRVELTVEGKRFLARATRAVAELDVGVHEMRDHASHQRGRLVVAAVPSIASKVLPLTLERFGHQLPNVRVEIMELMSSEIERAVSEGEADIGIVPRPAKKTNLAFSPLIADQFVAVVPTANALANRKSTTLQELSHQPIIAIKRGSNIRDSVEAAFARSKQKFTMRYTVAQPETALAMVAADLGVSILPTVFLSGSLPVSVVQIKPAIIREIGVVSRRGGPLSQIAVEFLRHMEQVVRSRGSRPKTI
ncbi:MULTISPECIES: LysR family transcriptional regulator [unclassified Beijerinckia]|uniref:LysR family transcriptional regulator n=1 Tax=unclassified Beijerinckia TaxID=2638183 RepID=UPI0008955FC4|nr:MULTISPECIES: LysR family transcriptional regulator [unclassified Beijerinckia]MDH7798955.1 LysR family carnitine catabolism transcriptional activator [Beijerinckia sp. GAS462]SED86000.1 LysR family transcriptional regulator, carnitine catabolism transcriptional activator [Beijerinckia sp. 28-YEA-48]